MTLKSRFYELDTPALILDLDKLTDNIQRMAKFADENKVKVRPHIKTHKCPEIAKRQIEAGAIGVTVAKLGEAEVMANAGINDIFVAYPIVGQQKIKRLVSLAKRVRMSVIIDSLEAALPISDAFKNAGLKLDCVIKIDSGLGRCGVQPGQAAVELAKKVVDLPGFNLRGISTHAGQVYGTKNQEERLRVGIHEGKVMADTARLLEEAGIPVEVVSVGSTPTVTISGEVPGVTEIRPGNYVFNDMMQVVLGSAELSQVSLSVLCRVISHPTADRALIDGGSKTFGLDVGGHGIGLLNGYGYIKGKDDIVINRLSEEHGFLKLKPGGSDVAINDLIEIIPNHACTVINNFKQIAVVSEGAVKEFWSVAAQGQLT